MQHAKSNHRDSREKNVPEQNWADNKRLFYDLCKTADGSFPCGRSGKWV